MANVGNVFTKSLQTFFFSLFPHLLRLIFLSERLLHV